MCFLIKFSLLLGYYKTSVWCDWTSYSFQLAAKGFKVFDQSGTGVPCNAYFGSSHTGDQSPLILGFQDPFLLLPLFVKNKIKPPFALLKLDEQKLDVKATVLLLCLQKTKWFHKGNSSSWSQVQPDTNDRAQLCRYTFALERVSCAVYLATRMSWRCDRWEKEGTWQTDTIHWVITTNAGELLLFA